MYLSNTSRVGALVYSAITDGQVDVVRPGESGQENSALTVLDACRRELEDVVGESPQIKEILGFLGACMGGYFTQ